MSVNLIMPYLAALIMFVYAGFVLQRFFVRRRMSFLFWGIGLAMFGIASLSGAILASQWNQWVFFAWYLFGAILTAAWIGQGTVYLLTKKKNADILTVVLILASLAVTLLLLFTLPKMDTSSYTTSEPISEQYRSMMPPINDGGIVRLTTPFFNIYGLITLVGGALYSSYLFWRKRVLPNRVIGNVLIAIGALAIASAGTLTRFGNGQFLYLGELVAATLMFAGFLVAASPRRLMKTKDNPPVSAN